MGGNLGRGTRWNKPIRLSQDLHGQRPCRKVIFLINQSSNKLDTLRKRMLPRKCDRVLAPGIGIFDARIRIFDGSDGRPQVRFGIHGEIGLRVKRHHREKRHHNRRRHRCPHAADDHDSDGYVAHNVLLYTLTDSGTPSPRRQLLSVKNSLSLRNSGFSSRFLWIRSTTRSSILSPTG